MSAEKNVRLIVAFVANAESWNFHNVGYKTTVLKCLIVNIQ